MFKIIKMNLLKLVVKKEIIINYEYIYNILSEDKKRNKTFKCNFNKLIIIIF